LYSEKMTVCRSLGETRPPSQRPPHRLHPRPRDAVVGEKGTPLSPYLQLRSDQQQRPISPGLLRLAHPCHAQEGETSRISSHPEAPAPPPPRHLSLDQGGRPRLRSFLWIWDEWGSGQGAWALLCGGREGGGVCRACGAQDRGCGAWGGVAGDPLPQCRR
jgi:hypothetical protein